MDLAYHEPGSFGFPLRVINSDHDSGPRFGPRSRRAFRIAKLTAFPVQKTPVGVEPT